MYYFKIFSLQFGSWELNVTFDKIVIALYNVLSSFVI